MFSSSSKIHKTLSDFFKEIYFIATPGYYDIQHLLSEDKRINALKDYHSKQYSRYLHKHAYLEISEGSNFRDVLGTDKSKYRINLFISKQLASRFNITKEKAKAKIIASIKSWLIKQDPKNYRVQKFTPAEQLFNRLKEKSQPVKKDIRQNYIEFLKRCLSVRVVERPLSYCSGGTSNYNLGVNTLLNNSNLSVNDYGFQDLQVHSNSRRFDNEYYFNVSLLYKKDFKVDLVFKINTDVSCCGYSLFRGFSYSFSVLNSEFKRKHRKNYLTVKGKIEDEALICTSTLLNEILKKAAVRTSSPYFLAMASNGEQSYNKRLFNENIFKINSPIPEWTNPKTGHTMRVLMLDYTEEYRR